MRKLTEEEIQKVADLLNHHSMFVEDHWKLTLAKISNEFDLTGDEVEELLDSDGVKEKWNL